MLTDEIQVSRVVSDPLPRSGLDTSDATSRGHATDILDGAALGNQAAPLAFGQVIGKCLLTEVIGRGGWCTVFRALHQTLNVTVAVKVLNPLTDESLLPVAHAQLAHEARLLARISHPHVVRIFDYQDDAVRPYLVLEYVDGTSLRELIQQSGRVHPKRARTLMRQVAHGLAALGALGGVHRDIKPANILLTRDGAAKIADFGQAVLLQPGREPASCPGADVTGTVAYVAPEQFLTPDQVDQRSDLYSLGVTFYEAVTGRLPFTGRSRMEILLKHTQEKPIPPRDIVPELDPAFSDLILSLLAKDRDDRPRNALEVCAAMSPRPSPPPAPAAAPTAPPSAGRDPSRPWWMALRNWLKVGPRRSDQLWLNSMQRALFSPNGQQSKAADSSGNLK